MQLTKEWFKKFKPCTEGVKWFLSNFKYGARDIDAITKLIADNELDWANRRKKMLSKETKQNLILSLLDMEQKQQTSKCFWEIGKDYIIRTVTMIYLGKLKDINETEFLLEDCAWIPDTSRWNEFVRGKEPEEMEPYEEDVIVGRGALLDATILNVKMERKAIG